VAACGSESADSPADAAPAPAPAAATAPAPVTEAPAATETAPVEPEATEAGAEASAEAADAANEAETPAPEAPAAPAAPVAPPAAALDPARAPREGIDYTVLAEPQPTFSPGAGIEVAEVFAYTCSHCANLQPAINTWKPGLASDVRFVYVPGAFGGVGDNFARAYFTAETTGLADKTHDAMFRAVLVDRAFKSGSLEELADWYGLQGADRDTFLSTMNSFAITAKVNRARQFALRTNVQATPTVIINGKYSASMTGDRGPQGLLDTIDWLVAQERAGTTP
jgi:thiol:disulfide interchange protein DsbA